MISSTSTSQLAVGSRGSPRFSSLFATDRDSLKNSDAAPVATPEMSLAESTMAAVRFSELRYAE